jgi:hypothetical protein
MKEEEGGGGGGGRGGGGRPKCLVKLEKQCEPQARRNCFRCFPKIFSEATVPHSFTTGIRYCLMADFVGRLPLCHASCGGSRSTLEMEKRDICGLQAAQRAACSQPIPQNLATSAAAGWRRVHAGDDQGVGAACKLDPAFRSCTAECVAVPLHSALVLVLQ